MTPASSYGTGARYNASIAREFYGRGIPYVDIKGEEGDLYLFNSEHLHMLPPLPGVRHSKPSVQLSRSRSVLGALVGYSAEPGSKVEVWS